MNFFRPHFHHWLSCVHNCEDRFRIHILICSSHFHVFTVIVKVFIACQLAGQMQPLCDEINDQNNLLLAVDLAFLKTKALQDVSSIQIQHLCQRKDDNQIDITFFKLPPAVKEVLSTLRRVQKSVTFQDLWTKYGNKAQAARRNDESRKQQLSLSDVVENVWKPAFKFWNQRVASVKDGTISLEDVDELFEGYRDRREELEEELSCMFEVSTKQTFTSTKELKPTVATRVVQIQRYQQLHQHVNAADTIWKFKGAMAFTGDFKVVEDLRNQVSY